MKKTEKHFPATWEKIYRLRVIDPDGWRDAGKGWGTLLTKKEWEKLISVSTIRRVSA